MEKRSTNSSTGYLIAIAVILISVFSCTARIESPETECVPFISLNFNNIDSLKTDPTTLKKAEIKADCLTLTLQYGGGCKEHQVDLALIPNECGTPPVPSPVFEIRHDAKADGCKALIEKEYSFNISGIRQNGKNKIDIIIRFPNSSGNWTNSNLTYEY